VSERGVWGQSPQDDIGRDDWIRTSDPLTPSQVRYQAALHPEIAVSVVSCRRASWRFALGVNCEQFAKAGLILLVLQGALLGRSS
jgi:hypothetical protein